MRRYCFECNKYTEQVFDDLNADTHLLGEWECQKCGELTEHWSLESDDDEDLPF